MASSEKIIAVDVDDVVADLISEWLRKYNKMSGDTLTATDIHSWEIGQYVKPGWSARLFQLLGEPDFYETVKPYQEARNAIRELRTLGRVLFLTSCVPNTMDQKFRWLCHNGFMDGVKSAANDFVACKDKWLIKADVLLDDHVVNVENFSGPAFLVRKPHNEKLSCVRERLPGGIETAYERVKRLFYTGV